MTGEPRDGGTDVQRDGINIKYFKAWLLRCLDALFRSGSRVPLGRVFLIRFKSYLWDKFIALVDAGL
mgnify:CR=1 FL=1